MLLHDPNARARFEMRLDGYPEVDLPLSEVRVEWLPGPCGEGCVRSLQDLLQLPEGGDPHPVTTPDGLTEPIQSRLQPLLRPQGPVARIECRPRRFEVQRVEGSPAQMSVIVDVRIGPAGGPMTMGLTSAHQVSLWRPPLDDAELDDIKRFIALQAFDRLVFAGRLLEGLTTIGQQLERGTGEGSAGPPGAKEI